MKDQCFDESTIQAFLDGELSPDLLERVARHVALCDDCALLLNEAEEESSFAFDLLGEEFNTLVPTERIRANVYQAISQIDKPRVSFWQKVLSFRILSNPSMVAFASLLIVAGVFTTVLSLKETKDLPPDTAAKIDKTNPSFEKIVQTPINSTTIAEAEEPEVEKPTQRPAAPKVEKVVYKPESRPVVNRTINRNEGRRPQKAEVVPALDGEDTYLKTIATLETTVNVKKDNVLRASSRVSYERDMAVINDSIKRMKEEVRKNPKNEAAKQILRNSYQNKIELLNSVTERSELMARLD